MLCYSCTGCLRRMAGVDPKSPEGWQEPIPVGYGVYFVQKLENWISQS